jgi:3-oxoacyl-[acyl-carrier protein] reductase
MVAKKPVAIVTGASRGIGNAIAKDLANQGYSLGLMARVEEDLRAAAREIQLSHPELSVYAMACDLASEEETTKAITTLLDQLGSVSVLVNNAGEYLQGTSTMAPERLRRLLEVNFVAACRLVQAVLPQMKEGRTGYIFNIASICGVEAYPEVGGYCASKFALVGYSEALDQELAPYGIKVTAICPSWVTSRMSSRSPVPPNLRIQPEDMASTVRYLLSLTPSARVRQMVVYC